MSLPSNNRFPLVVTFIYENNALQRKVNECRFPTLIFTVLNNR